jgi:hypothetical protein
MALVSDIVESWRAPRRVLRSHLARPKSEAFLFTFLFTLLLLAFVAQWPVAARMVYLQPEVPMEQRMFAAGLGLLATIPLWYGVAALSRLVARALGGTGTWYSARLALFWALVTITPGMLLMGTVISFLGQGPQANGLGALIAAVFLMFWIIMLHETEKAP